VADVLHFRGASRMTNELSPARAGALTGGIIGAACRPAVVAVYWLGGDQAAATWQAWVALLFASSAMGLIVGLLVGQVAGSVRRPVLGAVVGAVLGAALTFGSSVVTLCCLCLATDGRNTPLGPYWLTMCVTGAFAGVGGALAGGRVRWQQTLGGAEDEEPDREDGEDGDEDDEPGPARRRPAES
jgi:hypothetical protein